jgi:hypothetical protein
MIVYKGASPGYFSSVAFLVVEHVFPDEHSSFFATMVGMAVVSDMEKKRLGNAIETDVEDLAVGVLIGDLARESERRGIAIETAVRDLAKGILDNERQVNSSAIEIAGRGFARCGL